jgi:predicted secreted hydrolase
MQSNPLAGSFRYGFPGDHAVHPEFNREWWSYFGHLRTFTGLRYAVQVTFFRQTLPEEERGLPKGKKKKSLYSAHCAVTDEEKGTFTYLENFAHSGNRRSGSTRRRYHTWIGEWVVEQGFSNFHRILVTDFGFCLDLNFLAERRPVIHAVKGLKRKGVKKAHLTHCYSISGGKLSGVLLANGLETRVTGEGWFEREFGNSPLPREQLARDWFAIQFDHGEELALYMFRNVDGTYAENSSGTYVFFDATTSCTLSSMEIMLDVKSRWKSPLSGGEYPASWFVRIPRIHLEIEIEATLRDQELVLNQPEHVISWQGSVRVSGRLKERNVAGQGFVELAGY